MSGDDYLWDKSGAPDADVARLEGALAPLRYSPPAKGFALPPRGPRSRGRFAGVVLLLAAALGALGAIAVASRDGTNGEAIARRDVAVIEVARVAGAPRVSGGSLVAAERFGVGDWVETDASSRARVVLDKIGTVEVEPSSRVEVRAIGKNQQRLDLRRGAISARVDAPPRLFVVDTPSAAAVDLGCAYRLEVEDDGAALLRVTSGSVSLEGGGKTALVPAGASCRTAKGRGPGTPRFEDAPAELAAAVDRFDAHGDDREALAALPAARPRDSLTVWHLFLRVSPAARASVFARLRALVPPAKDIDEARAEALDRTALAPYEESLRETW